MTNREKLIEAMARAMCETWGYVWDGDPDDEQTAPETCCDITPGKILYREAATAALAAIEASGAVVVPVKATGAMLESADDALCGVAVGDLAHDIAGDTYAAMLAASPYAKEPRCTFRPDPDRLREDRDERRRMAKKEPTHD